MPTTINIRGVTVSFPFEPYEIQKDYMNKVIECLQNESNAILESPTGTGKTLCLLCAALAWLTTKKAQIQAQRLMPLPLENENEAWGKVKSENDFLQTLQGDLEQKAGGEANKFLGYVFFPTIIYASRTHSQLYQAMQELKRTAYTHLKAVVIGSREQLCIHPDIIKEQCNSTKIHMCQLKRLSKSCSFFNRVEPLKDTEMFKNTLLDIEDLVQLGKKHKFCPYYMSKEIKRNADIIFMPYNYLLDPALSKSLGIELTNSIVIMDEAHNVEKVCEEAASIQLKSTDIAMCIEEITLVMKAMVEEPVSFDSETPKDFTADELCVIKEMFLRLEKVVDDLEVKTNDDTNGTTYEGDYIFTILEQAGINQGNHSKTTLVLDRVMQFITAANQGGFQKRGDSLELFISLIRSVFHCTSPEFKEKVKKCFKVHICEEQTFKNKGFDGNAWLSKAKSSKVNKVVNYWCFNPGIGINMMIERGIKSLILTSGTLAPLKPLITELNLHIPITLENAHIVQQNQVCIRILNKGPDGIELNSSFANRNNPTYLSSLGRTILNLARIIPDGLLIFFPSYPVLDKCRQHWENEGLWAGLCSQKAIFVEPKQKLAFNTAMTDFYSRIKDPNYKGAIFMGVCRGKISEGLDFADANGRAVMIIGLPYPPFKDPKVVLKKQYLDRCRINDKQYISGSDWYSLEAIRAVNQAIGRVIRHKDDYGAIILLDSRFAYERIQSQLSLWLRKQVKLVNNFGEIVRNLREFYRNAETNLPTPKDKPTGCAISALEVYKKPGNFDFTTSSACSSLNGSSESTGLVTIHKQNTETALKSNKRKRIVIVPPTETKPTDGSVETSTKEFISMVKRSLQPDDYHAFLKALNLYRQKCDIDDLTNRLDAIFLDKFKLRYIIQGLFPFIKNIHKTRFTTYWEQMR